MNLIEVVCVNEMIYMQVDEQEGNQAERSIRNESSTAVYTTL